MPVNQSHNVEPRARSFRHQNAPASASPNRHRRRLRQVVAVLLISFSFHGVIFAAPVSVAVLYPNVPAPYEDIFLEIVRGIKQQLPDDTHEYVLDNKFDIRDLRAWLTQQKTDVIIALGRRGFNAATAATDKIPIVSGALLLTPSQEKGNVAGISLAADPKLLFTRLLSLVPGIKRIQTVYDPKQNAWLMRLAAKEAAALKLKLVTYPADSLREAVYDYKRILFDADPKQDALWLPVDSTTVNDQVVLPLVLSESWDRALVVFSSNPAHASKGALFSVFPDNKALGRSLATMALHMSKGGDGPPALYALDNLLFAINQRTADHLGLGFSAERRQRFDFVFPSQ